MWALAAPPPVVALWQGAAAPPSPAGAYREPHWQRPVADSGWPRAGGPPWPVGGSESDTVTAKWPFPKYIGCEIAGGDWSKHERVIRQFAGLHPHLQVYIVERGPIAMPVINGQPIPGAGAIPSSPGAQLAVVSFCADFVWDTSSQRCGSFVAAAPAQPAGHGACLGPASHVTSRSVEAFDVIASQRAADDLC